MEMAATKATSHTEMMMMPRKLVNPKTKCVECGGIVPYQGTGRPRMRHVRCMNQRQKTERTYMKSYMPKYYARGDNMEKHNETMRQRRRKSDDLGNSEPQN